MCRSISLYLGLWVSLGITGGQDVIFEDLPTRITEDPCTMTDGGPGRCRDILNCPEVRRTFFTNPPVHCGFVGNSPVVCCPVTSEPVTKDPKDGLIPILDISPPDFGSDFECGRSAVKTTQSSSSSPSFSSRFKRATPKPVVLSPFTFKRATPADILDLTITEFFNPANQPSVVGGRPSFRNAWPWMALLGSREQDSTINWFCGGVLINDQWVITAAHCLGPGLPQIVRLGEHNYNDNSDANHQDYEVLERIRYPNYTFPVAYHDIALLQLKEKVKLQRFISPVCLPWGEESQRDLSGSKVKLTGWGDTKFAGKPSSVLQEVDLTLFPISKCQESYSSLTKFQLNWPNGMGNETACAGDVNGGRDACQGDSGGPLTYQGENGRFVLNGIVSTGYGCGNKDFPGIYANVQHPPYLVWIKKVAFGGL